jgi:hypothetical protein
MDGEAQCLSWKGDEMSNQALLRRFEEIGARAKLVRAGRPRIDVRVDRRGEYFELGVLGLRDADVMVVETDDVDRALLLLVRNGWEKSKFLCGFDERHWFVAAIPEAADGVAGVVSAKDALQPEAVRERVARVRPKDRFRRRNAAYVRQGEWFFLPAGSLVVDERDVLHDEPLSRGWGKIHRLEFAYRIGGETVYVSSQFPTGLTEEEFDRLSPRQQRDGGPWQEMVRDPELYAKGSVRHPDHATIRLHGWHRVLMNTEREARAMQHVAFLD